MRLRQAQRDTIFSHSFFKLHFNVSTDIIIASVVRLLLCKRKIFFSGFVVCLGCLFFVSQVLKKCVHNNVSKSYKLDFIKVIRFMFVLFLIFETV